jgi:hypothetical protein
MVLVVHRPTKEVRKYGSGIVFLHGGRPSFAAAAVQGAVVCMVWWYGVWVMGNNILLVRSQYGSRTKRPGEKVIAVCLWYGMVWWYHTTIRWYGT